jgi:hypothetical protein
MPTAIVAVVEANPGIVLVDKIKREEFYNHVKREVESFVHDLSTDAGRKRTAALAYKVSRSKTAIDDAGAALKAEWLEKSRVVDSARKKIRDDFDALRDQARKPLTDWEEQEELRKSNCLKIIEQLKSAAIVPMDASMEYVTNVLGTIQHIDVSPERFREFSTSATDAKKHALLSLTAAMARIEKEERERAELASLRAENEARLAADQEAARLKEEQRLKAEAEEKARLTEERRQREVEERIEAAKKAAEERARIQAEHEAQEAREKLEREHAAELKRIKDEAEKWEADRLETVAKAFAAEKAEREAAEVAAKKERDRIAALHQAELDKARKAQEEAEARERAESRRIAEAESKRVAEEARLKAVADAEAAAAKKLAENKAHRTALKTATKEALMEQCQLTETQAIAVVTAVINKTIPNFEMRFA